METPNIEGVSVESVGAVEEAKQKKTSVPAMPLEGQGSVLVQGH